MDQPQARYSHTAVKVNGKEAYIFGGYDDKKNSCYGDMHKYSYSKFFLII